MPSIPKTFVLDVKRIKEPTGTDYMCSETSSAMLLTDLGIETTPNKFYRECSLQYRTPFYDPYNGWMGFDEVFPCINTELRKRGKGYSCRLENLNSIDELKMTVYTTKKPVLVSVLSQIKNNKKYYHTFPVVGYNESSIIYHDTDDFITKDKRIIDNTYAEIPYELLDKKWKETNRKAIYCTPNDRK
jgi:hypothetical protein